MRCLKSKNTLKGPATADTGVAADRVTGAQQSGLLLHHNQLLRFFGTAHCEKLDLPMPAMCPVESSGPCSAGSSNDHTHLGLAVSELHG